jgi:hypothetical protein
VGIVNSGPTRQCIVYHLHSLEGRTPLHSGFGLNVSRGDEFLHNSLAFEPVFGKKNKEQIHRTRSQEEKAQKHGNVKGRAVKCPFVTALLVSG